MTTTTRPLSPLAERDLERVRVTLARLREAPLAALRSPEDLQRAALRRAQARGCTYDEARRELVNALAERR
jgi:uncharacterized protein YjbI with pentapeptide repeats